MDETSSSNSSSESGEDSDAEDEGADDELEGEELPLPRAQIEAEEEALGKVCFIVSVIVLCASQLL